MSREFTDSKVEKFLDQPGAQIVIVPSMLAIVGYATAGEDRWVPIVVTLLLAASVGWWMWARFSARRRSAREDYWSTAPLDGSRFVAGVVLASTFNDRFNPKNPPPTAGGPGEERDAREVWQKTIAGRLASQKALRRLAVVATELTSEPAQQVADWCDHLQIECRVFQISGGEETDVDAVAAVCREALAFATAEVGEDLTVADVTGGLVPMSLGLFTAAAGAATAICYQRTNSDESVDLMELKRPSDAMEET